MTIDAGGSAGHLCISGGIRRFNGQVAISNIVGNIAISLNLDGISASGGPTAFAPGDTRNFQCWFRDVQNGTATPNFTNAVAVTLL